MNFEIPIWAQPFPSNNKIVITKMAFGISQIVKLNFDTDFDNICKYITFGRNPECNVVIDDISCSRRHAIICYGNAKNKDKLDNKENCYWICDMGTQNGTILNNHEKLKPLEWTMINNGYFVQIGVSDEKYLLEYPIDIRGVDVDNIEEEKVENDNMSIHDVDSGDNVNNVDNVDNVDYVNWGQIDDINDMKESLKVNEEQAPIIDDPIKVVKKFFEREGYEFEPKYEKLKFKNQTVYDAKLV